jgi:hypothetical protein
MERQSTMRCRWRNGELCKHSYSERTMQFLKRHNHENIRVFGHFCLYRRQGLKSWHTTLLSGGLWALKVAQCMRPSFCGRPSALPARTQIKSPTIYLRHCSRNSRSLRTSAAQSPRLTLPGPADRERHLFRTYSQRSHASSLSVLPPSSNWPPSTVFTKPFVPCARTPFASESVAGPARERESGVSE